jgi:dTDP-4-amino-4,6-dideoxygalactose transaminase
MKIGRTVPPSAAPLDWSDLWNGVAGMLRPRRALGALAAEIRLHFGVRHVFLMSSGTAALTLTLKVVRSQSLEAEAIIPAYTCFSVPAAVLQAGLKPVLCDIDPSTFDFDHALLARSVTSRTVCIVAHHLFGLPSDVERIRALCRNRGVVVVEDAAQAMGVESDGRQLGTVGDVGIFSLGRGKQITCGSGGIIVTSDDRIAAAIRREYEALPAPDVFETLTDFLQLAFMKVLIRPALYWIPAAVPFLRLGQTIFPTRIIVARMSGMKAGVLRRWRLHLTRSNRIRSQTATYFRERMPLPTVDDPAHPYLRLPVYAATPEHKKKIYSLSQARGLGLSAAYPAPVSDIPAVRALVNGYRCPTAEAVSKRLLTLPTHHWLSETDKQAIAELWRTAPSA